eukprot:15696977-Heterocapsa_arctica.AAC.1
MPRAHGSPSQVPDFLTRREMGPLGLPSGAGYFKSCSQAGGTISPMLGSCASFLIHPPIMLEERKRLGSSHEFGDTRAK